MRFVYVQNGFGSVRSYVSEVFRQPNLHDRFSVLEKFYRLPMLCAERLDVGNSAVHQEMRAETPGGGFKEIVPM